MKIFKHFLTLLLVLLCWEFINAQETATLFGRVTDNRQRPIELVNIAVMGFPGGNVTDRNGMYEIAIPAGQEVTVVYSYVGYSTERSILFLQSGQRKELNKMLTVSATDLPTITVEDKQVRSTTLSRIDPKEATLIPTVSGGAIESIIKTLPGVAATNELSSQYSVRGGNYDENLVYVNDIEIYRPFLVRASQQEGLSFLNSDLVSSISFSAGGFDAKYGDKMSSVLDINYKKPTEFAGSFSASLMGATMHVEGMVPDKGVTYLLGARYKSNSYVLKSLETSGDYKPNFLDIQSLITYEVNPKLAISFLGYFARNSYNLIPQTRETAFGAITEAYKFTVFFDGNEADRFMNYMGGLTFAYKVRNNVEIKLITSAFRSLETENFDILGQYWISRLETDFSDEEFGEPTELLGVGTFLNHARNELDATVWNSELRGTAEKANHYVQWGVKFQQEIIEDKISEWELLDSAGYSLPHPPDSIGYTFPELQPDHPLEIYNVIKNANRLNTHRLSAFLQDSWSFIDTDSVRLMLTYGARMQYWTYNNELIFSPRATLAFKPNWDHDIVFRFSTGYYYQPAFYRELRNLQGELNPDISAQKSVQFVLGSDWNFTAWGRPFKFVTEAYYKHMYDLIPYIIDNVRIRYYATNDSHGYAYGIDLKVNGEFVKGIESWGSISFLNTQEDIEDDYFISDIHQRLYDTGYLRRPTDQRINVGLFFQDYLPKNPTYKMHLNLLYGTNLPFGPPDQPKYTHIYESSPYFRVDVGFSKQLIGEGTFFGPKNPFRHFSSMWLSLEVFNLLQHKNTVSYLWVRTVDAFQYPVPNRLTPRQLNVRLVVEF